MTSFDMVLVSVPAIAAIGTIPVAAAWLAVGGIAVALLDLWKHFRAA